MNWHPIETAPKDGTRILVSSKGWVVIAYWDESAKFGGGFTDDHPGWQTNASDGDEYYANALEPSEVTHWMSLPEPPK